MRESGFRRADGKFDASTGQGAASLPSSLKLPWILAVAAVIGVGVVSALYFRRAKPAASEMRVEMVVPATDDHSSFAYRRTGDEWLSPHWTEPQKGYGCERWIQHRRNCCQAPKGPSVLLVARQQFLGFFADFKLKRIDLGRAPPRVLAAVPSISAQGTWGTGGVILFSWGVTPVSRVSASGGQSTLATQARERSKQPVRAAFIPGRQQFLYIVKRRGPEHLARLAGWRGSRRISSIAVGTDSAAEYLAPGWLVRVRLGVLEAQRFDVDLGQLSGDPSGSKRS